MELERRMVRQGNATTELETGGSMGLVYFTGYYHRIHGTGIIYLHYIFTIRKQRNVGKYTSHMDPMCGIHIWLLHGKCRYLKIPYMDPMGICITNHWELFRLRLYMILLNPVRCFLGKLLKFIYLRGEWEIPCFKDLSLSVRRYPASP